MKVVVSIGGSVLVPDLEAGQISEHAAVVEELADAGCTVGAVVGGGPTAREYVGTARELGANEIALDELGIATTRLNARLLIAGLEGRAAPKIPADYETAGEVLRREEIVVMGGVTPGQTTDAVSAALAEYVDADLLVYATSVPGVFSDDPNEVDGAEKYREMTPGELVDTIAGNDMKAATSAPVDLLAAKLIERSGMRTVVLDGTDPSAIADAVLRGDHDGTDVIPAGSDEPSYWAER
jgi:uridylate kinase